MSTYVLDTSVVVQWFHQAKEEHVLQAKKILKDLQAGKITVILPDILSLELLNALIKGKGLFAEQAIEALDLLYKLPVNVIEVSLPFLGAAAELMDKYNLTSYDAYFLALAQQEGYILVSDDQIAHGKIASGSVLMLEDY